MELFNHEEINEFLQSSQIGLWKLEFGDGYAPRLYADSMMDELLGIDHSLTPEERYIFHRKGIHPDDFELFLSYTNDLLQKQTEVVYRYLHPTRGEMYVRCNGMRNFSNTSCVEFKGSHQDISNTIRLEKGKITEQRLAEENLILKKNKGYSEQFYSRLIKLQTCGIVAYKIPSHEILVMNDTAKHLYGLEVFEEESDLSKIYSYIQEANSSLSPSVRSKLKSLKNPGDSFSYSMLIPHNDGSKVHVFATTQLIEIENGDLIIISSLQDISMITSIQKNNNRLREQAEEIISLNKQLHDEQIELEYQYSFAEAMSRDTKDIFILDFKNKTSTSIKINGNVLSKEERVTRPYEDTYRQYIKKYVHPEDQKRLASTFNLSFIQNTLYKQESFSCNYRINFENQMYYYQVTFIKLAERIDDSIVFGFRCVDDIVHAEQEQLLHERELLIHLKMLMMAVDTVYPRVSEVNLTTNEINNLAMDTFLQQQTDALQGFDAILEFASTMIPDDGQREEYMKHFSRNNQIAAYHRGEKSISYDHQQIGSDGIMHWMNTQVIFVDSANNDIMQVALSRYIDEDIKKQEELREAIRKAEDANRAKTTFLNNMSHDIRTPMNAILGFAGLIKKSVDNPHVVHDYINKIEDSGNYLLSIINNILDMARIDSGKLELREDIIDISEIKDGYLDLLSHDIERKNLKFEYKIDVHHRYVYGDSVRLNQVFINLLSNSVKYTPINGKIRFMVEEVDCKKEGYASFRITVQDTGIGMSKEFQAKLFDSFTRERNSTESKVMGTGLGMSIVKRIIDIMGGSIDVQSEVDHGSTFLVSFSLMIVEDLSDCDLVEEKFDEEQVDFSHKRILLVEDNELNAEIAIEILSSTGLQVDHAEDGLICLDLLEQANSDYYDLILMDIQMPNMDGYETTRRIRNFTDLKKARIPIIAMTANAFSEDNKLSKEAGMNAHLSKPIDVPQLMSTLRQYMKE